VRAEERNSPIRDEAKLFHASSIERAEQRIADIRRTFGRNVFVQTVVSVSPQPRRWFLFLFLKTRQDDHMLEQQAHAYASEHGRPGVYVVICMDPRGVGINVRPEDGQEFKRCDLKTLRRSLARNLQDRGSDSALLAFLDQIHDVLHDNATRGSSAIINGVPLAGLLGGGLSLWLSLRLIRFRLRASRTATAWSAGSVNEPGTQARETAGLLGAMFGFPAGLWIYDKLYPSPPGVTPLCPPPGEPEPPGDKEKSTKVDRGQHPLSEPAEDAPVSP
jgi:hypothetical protein